MIAHIYPSVLQAVSGWGYAGRLDGCFQGYRGEAMHYLGYELRRIPIPRTSVNRGQDKGPGAPRSKGPSPLLRLSHKPESVRLPPPCRLGLGAAGAGATRAL